MSIHRWKSCILLPGRRKDGVGKGGAEKADQKPSNAFKKESHRRRDRAAGCNGYPAA